MLATKKPKGPNTSQWTVAKYINEIYIPAKQHEGRLTNLSAEWYRQVVARLDKCFGRPVKLRELNDEMLVKLEMWTVQSGSKRSTASQWRHILKSVLRHWRPDEHPKSNGAASLGFLVADVEGTLENLFQTRYLNEKPEISSPDTVKQYGRSLRKFSEFLGHDATAADLTDENLGAFLRWRLTTGQVNPRTANGEAKQIKALWNWAAKKRLVAEFPTIGKLPEPELIPDGWTHSQLDKLIAAGKATDGRFGSAGAAVPASDYWVAFHYVLWDTAERTGAMLALKFSMLDESTGHLKVPAELRKGKRKAMVYRLKPRTVDALKRIRRGDRDLIFEMGGIKSRFYYHYQKLVKAAGLPWIPHRTGPQKMRRSFASHVSAAGGDATAALRHSSRRVTEESYLDPAIANPTPANELLFDL